MQDGVRVLDYELPGMLCGCLNFVFDGEVTIGVLPRFQRQGFRDKASVN